MGLVVYSGKKRVEEWPLPAWQNEHEKRALFEEVAVAHLPSLYSGAYRLAGNRTDAEDLVQETFARAYAAFERFTLGTNARAWLYRIMNNIYLNQVNRAENKRSQPFSVFSEADMERHSNATSPDPADIVAAHTLDSRLKKALGELSGASLSALVAVDVGGFSYEEAAAILDCPVGTVRSRLHRARTLLRLRLTELGDDQTLADADKRVD
jgi:RNA polymerase sigma-70 factor (ECF subfamily)